MLQYAKPEGIIQWAQIDNLYQKAFPAAEKKPFGMVLKMYRKGASDVCRFTRNTPSTGTTTINGPQII
ncbi:MAG: hypothetical protein J6D13_07825 [Clostridium sp.]|nr:hypothetical protein [Clostridium sp.]